MEQRLVCNKAGIGDEQFYEAIRSFGGAASASNLFTKMKIQFYKRLCALAVKTKSYHRRRETTVQNRKDSGVYGTSYLQ